MVTKKDPQPEIFLPGWDDPEHVYLGRNAQGLLDLLFEGRCEGCRDSHPNMKATIDLIAKKSGLGKHEAAAFFLGFATGVDSMRRYHRLGDYLDDDEILTEFFSGKRVAGRFH
jgi:hypothetical protein